MYPDTDSPPTPINEKDLIKIKKTLPEPIWDCEKRLKKLGLSDPLIKSLSISKHLNLFNKIIETLDVPPILVAVILEEKMKWLRRNGNNVDSISDKTILDLFELFSKNKISKEAIPVILKYLAAHPRTTVKNALKELQIVPMSKEELQQVVDDILVTYTNPTKLTPSFNIIMHQVMSVARLRIDGKIIAEIVKSKLEHYTKSVDSSS